MGDRMRMDRAVEILLPQCIDKPAVKRGCFLIRVDVRPGQVKAKKKNLRTVPR